MTLTDPTAQLGPPGAPGTESEEDKGRASAIARVETNGAAATDAGAAEGVAVAAPAIVEPTETGDIDVSTLEGLGVLPVPSIPLPLIKRRVTGRYRSTGVPFQVELRVDVDGPRPTMRVSADYYAITGATVSYFGSMRVDAATVTVHPTLVTITGLGTYTWAAGAPRVKITIPRVPVFLPAAAAMLQHLTLGGQPGAAYICKHVSAFLRSVILEQDRQDTVATPFASYNTGLLPSGGPARTLSVAAAYAEAQIEMQASGAVDVVNTSEAGANASWSDAELHAAMVNHFSLWRDVPQWAVWLLHAQLHDLGPGLLGIMFDQVGRQRQGAAVFYAGLAGSSSDQQRLQLYTCVHELGHCFNLLHSWQKSLATPPASDRPSALSWMNYPWRFPGGPAAFWSAFAFQFDNEELVHVRHGFRDAVIMGGNPFTVGSALEDPGGWRDAIEDDSGLRLELQSPRNFTCGVPVSVTLVLSTTDLRGKRVGRNLRPRNGAVEVAIQQPSGRVLVYRPLLQHCVRDDDGVVLDGDRPAISETAFLHYGQDGFYFEQPGTYRLRARYHAPDGSIVLSDLHTLRVKSPITAEDQEAAELMFGDEQGTLLYLVGSDFKGLQAGNDAFAELRERFPDHPLAQVAALVQGVNEAREFKHVAPDNTVSVRAPDRDRAGELLAPFLDVAAARKAASKAQPDAIAMTAAAAEQIVDVGSERAPDDIAAFIRARRREIAAEVMPEVPTDTAPNGRKSGRTKREDA